MTDKTGPITDEEAQKILSRFNASHWNNETEHARYSIPADPRRDDDIRLGAYIEQTRELRAQLATALQQCANVVTHARDALESLQETRWNPSGDIAQWRDSTPDGINFHHVTDAMTELRAALATPSAYPWRLGYPSEADLPCFGWSTRWAEPVVLGRTSHLHDITHWMPFPAAPSTQEKTRAKVVAALDASPERGTGREATRQCAGCTADVPAYCSAECEYRARKALANASSGAEKP
jgi:hypothetical protein